VIHVLEYLWTTAWCSFAEGDPSAEAWVGDKALAILDCGARGRSRGDPPTRLE
jgi:hypothetical protein